ncbi:hypothetical protein H9L39_04697 [Fusarium oxysporum f. sp. albedinis]|nr:hypothetical protein H9L39_04697 [Fusarium oxysporum f. sp. albedinis]
MQIDCSLTLTHSLLQNPRDGKKQLHLDICCIVRALSSSFSLLPPSSFTPKTVAYLSLVIERHHDFDKQLTSSRTLRLHHLH